MAKLLASPEKGSDSASKGVIERRKKRMPTKRGEGGIREKKKGKVSAKEKKKKQLSKLDVGRIRDRNGFFYAKGKGMCSFTGERKKGKREKRKRKGNGKGEGGFVQKRGRRKKEA